MMRYGLLFSMLLLSSVSLASPQTPELFDAHLHYNADQVKMFTPVDIIIILDQNKVNTALVTSSPTSLALQLHQHAPNRIIPFLGLYQADEDKQTWHQDKGLPARVAHTLKDSAWRGIGELHLFAEHRHSPVFEKIALLASSHQLPLLVHTDPVVIDRLFEIVTNVTVIWAHGGAYPYPALLSDYLKRYPNLYIDLSMRNERIAPNGTLDPEWELLLIEFSNRFLIGVDTYSTHRWQHYSDLIDTTRHWMDQLPLEVEMAIGHENALRLFQPRPGKTAIPAN
jgi:hypothetical protein